MSLGEVIAFIFIAVFYVLSLMQADHYAGTRQREFAWTWVSVGTLQLLVLVWLVC